MADRELARITASGPRRVIGTGSMIFLGAVLLYIAMATPPESLFWRVFLLVLGAAILWLSHALWKATGGALILTHDGLYEEGGPAVAELSNIRAVERGMLALKASNGFNIVLKEPRPRVWRPGLWWRIGRRVAIGGVTSAHQTRPVADILLLKVKERDD